jgi:hypothetical protein
MRPVINPAILSVVNSAAGIERAMQPMRDAMARMVSAVAPPTGLTESLRQIRKIEAVAAPPTGLTESFRQMREAVPTIKWAFAAPLMQSAQEREPKAPIAPVADSHVAPPAPALSKKKNKGNWGPRRRTRAAAVALGLYVAEKGHKHKLTPSGLAKHAADFATEQGFKDADLLDPGDSTLRILAEDYLAGMAKVVANK